jgi:hypothetical protein
MIPGKVILYLHSLRWAAKLLLWVLAMGRRCGLGCGTSRSNAKLDIMTTLGKMLGQSAAGLIFIAAQLVMAFTALSQDTRRLSESDYRRVFRPEDLVQLNEIDRSKCVDLKNIETDVLGFTYFRYGPCASPTPPPERAIACSEMTSDKVKIFIHGPEWYEQVFDPDSIDAKVARWVCRMRR